MTVGLSALQERMALAVRHEHAVESHAAWSSFAAEHLCGSERLSPVEQLEIYREQFWLRHTGALLEDFPGLAGLLGPEDWQRLAVQYLCEHCASSYTLRDLGLLLPTTIERAIWLPHRELCLDMARLEVAYLETFDAPDSTPLSPEALSNIPSTRLGTCRMLVAPSVKMLSVRYSVADLRRRLQDDAFVTIPEPSSQNLVIHRESFRVRELVVSDTAYAFLWALAAGGSLSRAAEHAASSPEREGELTAGIGDWLREWVAKGILTSIERS